MCGDGGGLHQMLDKQNKRQGDDANEQKIQLNILFDKNSGIICCFCTNINFH